MYVGVSDVSLCCESVLSAVSMYMWVLVMYLYVTVSIISRLYVCVGVVYFCVRENAPLAVSLWEIFWGDTKPVKISSPDDLYYVEWDVKPYSTKPLYGRGNPSQTHAWSVISDVGTSCMQ